MRTPLLSALLVTACSGPAHPPARSEVVEAGEARAPKRPSSPRGTVVDRLHGVDVADPYRWLETVERPEAAEWTREQDTFARHWLAALPGRAALRTALRPLLEAESRSAPVRRGGLWFYSRRRPGDDKSRFFVSDVGGQNERVLVDPNTMGQAVTVRGVSPSPSGRYVTFLRSSNASDDATLIIRDVQSGEDLDAPIDGARYAAPSWLPDESAFFYTSISTDPKVPPPQRPGTAAILRHAVGTDSRYDARVFGPLGDNQSFLSVDVSPQGRWITVTRFREFTYSEIHVADLRADALSFEHINDGHEERAFAQVDGDRMLLHTNRDAPRFRVLELDLRRPQRSWREVVAQGPGTLDSLHVSADAWVLQWLDKAHSRLEVRDPDGTRPRTLTLPGLGTVSAIVGSPLQNDAFILYSSFADPPQWHHVRPSTGERTLFWKQEVPIDTDRIDVEQVWVESRDGTAVSMFVVHRDDAPLDGDRPTLLTGYGGFGVSLTPVFSPTAALWVEHGGVFAVPNLRGGGEYGEAWHDAGRGANKQNVFDDFIASAQWLVDARWTRPDRLAIRGGSNGGLLVGAAMTQRPELFGAVVCEVPLLDMVRYHLFGAGPTWIGEYGSADDPQQFETLLAYSPYHHVERGAPYPPLLMNSADSDDRVDPNHARKFVAAMQWATPDSHPVLLRVEAQAGHGGADSVKKRVDKAVDTLSFLRATVGR